jgi:hypothetical protein
MARGFERGGGFEATEKNGVSRDGCNRKRGEWEELLDRRSLGVVGYAPISGGDAAFGALLARFVHGPQNRRGQGAA